MKENSKLVLNIFWRQISSLFFLLLLVSALVSLFMGEKVDGIIILVIMTINLVLGFAQEFRASKASAKLLNLVETKVYVLRGGVLVQIPTKELVVGDVVHLVAGSIAPVDIQVIESNEVYVDESVRTGETIPKAVRMGDIIFAGSVVSTGKVIGSVIAVGDQSSLAKYREKLEAVKKWSSFTSFTEKVIKYIFTISLATLVVSMFLLVLIMGKYTLASFFIFSIAMLVGVVPEVLPLIVTIILTRESLLLSKEKVIVKRLSALESVGAVKFLLTDKTGTITENKLKVAFVNDLEDFWEYSNSVSEGEYERMPMDKAYDEALNSSVAHLKTSLKKIKTFTPFNHSDGYEVFTLEGGEKVARGIVGKVLELCKLEGSKYKSVLNGALAYEEKGMRVMAQAKGVAGVWEFSGFVAFHDPIKASASESLKVAHSQGILVKILTGDTKSVATYVAEELHLIKDSDNIISLEGIKVSDLSDRQLTRAVVFAKCTPENKLELMNRFIKLGPVAFLGDGINDALALKRADIGIAVDNASDIAKESSDIILLEKDLSPILKSVALGRKALRNILVYIMYTLAGNAGTFFSLIVASFFYPVLPMLPIQILLNNLLTDLPLMLIITDNPDEYALRHVPHFEPKKVMQRVFIFGLISSVFDLVYFHLYRDHSVIEFQTGWFVLSIFAELALILSIRSSRSLFKSPTLSVPLALGIGVSFLLPFLFIYTAPLAKVFKFTALPLEMMLVLCATTLSYIIVNELAKYIMRRKNLYNKPLTLTNLFK